MESYEENRVKWLIDKPIGLFLTRRSGTLRRAGAMPTLLIQKAFSLKLMTLVGACDETEQSVRIASLGRMKINLLQPCIPYRDASLTGCKAEILSVFLPSDTSLRDAD